MRHQGQGRCAAALMVMVPIPVRLAVGRHGRRAEQGGGGRVSETGWRIWTQRGQEENLLVARFRSYMVAAAAVRSTDGICIGAIASSSLPKRLELRLQPVDRMPHSSGASSHMEMSYPLNRQQFQAVSALASHQRYRHFIGRVSDWQLVWGLRNEGGWVTALYSNGNPVAPFWPHPDYAIACAVGEWAGNAPASIDIHHFLSRWLPGMEKDGMLAAVFPTPAMQGVFVSPRQLQSDIEEELSCME